MSFLFLWACTATPPTLPEGTVGRTFWRIGEEDYHAAGFGALLPMGGGRVVLSPLALFGPAGGLPRAWTVAEVEATVEMGGLSRIDGEEVLTLAPRPMFAPPGGDLVAMRLPAGPALAWGGAIPADGPLFVAAAAAGSRTLSVWPVQRGEADGAMLRVEAPVDLAGAEGAPLLDRDGAVVGLLVSTTPALVARAADALRAGLPSASE